MSRKPDRDSYKDRWSIESERRKMDKWPKRVKSQKK